MTNVQDVDGLTGDGEQNAIAPMKQLADFKTRAALWGEGTAMRPLLKRLRGLEQTAAPLSGASGGVVLNVLVDGLEVGFGERRNLNLYGAGAGPPVRRRTGASGRR